MVGNECLGALGAKPMGAGVIEKVQLGGMFLVFARFVLLIQGGIERQDFEALRVRHFFVEGVVAVIRRLGIVHFPAFPVVRKGFAKEVTDAGVQWKADPVHRVFGGVLAEIAITQVRHDRQLVQVQGTELIVGREHGAERPQWTHLEQGVPVR